MSDTIDLGDGHTLTYSNYKESSRVGCSIAHKTKDGKDCNGWIAFAGRAWAESFGPGQITTWDVVQDEPLSLTPSISCRACGDHGHVTNGRWVKST